MFKHRAGNVITVREIHDTRTRQTRQTQQSFQPVAKEFLDINGFFLSLLRSVLSILASTSALDGAGSVETKEAYTGVTLRLFLLRLNILYGTHIDGHAGVALS